MEILLQSTNILGQDGQYTHGPDAVISMVDHAFTHLNVPGDECRPHADNYFGMHYSSFLNIF